MDRVTVRDAERQVARLAKVTGHTMVYANMRRGDVVGSDMADAVEPRTPGSWFLDQSAAGGWLTIRGYDKDGRQYTAINHDSFKAATLWDAVRLALDVIAQEKLPA